MVAVGEASGRFGSRWLAASLEVAVAWRLPAVASPLPVAVADGVALDAVLPVDAIALAAA